MKLVLIYILRKACNNTVAIQKGKHSFRLGGTGKVFGSKEHERLMGFGERETRKESIITDIGNNKGQRWAHLEKQEVSFVGTSGSWKREAGEKD